MCSNKCMSDRSIIGLIWPGEAAALAAAFLNTALCLPASYMMACPTSRMAS